MALGIPATDRRRAGPRSCRHRHQAPARDPAATRPSLPRPEGREAFEGLVVAALTLDEDEHNNAIDAAFRAAVRTGRRRMWALVRRSAAEGLGRFCPTCRVHGLPSDGLYDDERVLALCADAACALLVSDAVDPWTSAKLDTRRSASSSRSSAARPSSPRRPAPRRPAAHARVQASRRSTVQVVDDDVRPTPHSCARAHP